MIHFIHESEIEENQNQDLSVLILGSTHELSDVEASWWKDFLNALVIFSLVVRLDWASGACTVPCRPV